MRWISLGRIVALAGVALLVAGPLGTRLGLWPFLIGFLLLASSLLCGLVGASLSLAGGVRTRQWGASAVGILVGLAVVAVPSIQIASAGGAPPIHDITTDPQDPPAFVAALLLREGAANPPEYDGAAAADQQRRAFPDIQPLVLAGPPDQAFARALAVVSDLGWQVVAEAPAEGRIEAVDTTFWFGFKDDVVIRVRAADGGSRVDIRSKSRVGLGDAGANARRVRAFARRMRG